MVQNIEASRWIFTSTPSSAATFSSALREDFRPLCEHRIRVFALKLPKRRDPGAHRDRVRTQRSCLINRACRRHEIHKLSLSAVSAHRKNRQPMILP